MESRTAQREKPLLLHPAPRHAAARRAQLCALLHVPQWLFYPRVPRVSEETRPAKRLVRPDAVPKIEKGSVLRCHVFVLRIKGVLVLLYNVHRIPSCPPYAISGVTAVNVTPEIM